MSYDLLAVGECLVDLISVDHRDSLTDADRFLPFAGGSVCNTAMNVARLGGRVGIVGVVGDDGFGRRQRAALRSAGVDTGYLVGASGIPTTVAVVARSTGTPDFLVYRGADRLLDREHLPAPALTSTRWLHTSAFALSADPARRAVFEALRLARASGASISLDPNYHPQVWRGEDPIPVFDRVLPMVDVVKPSLDDCRRLFGPDEAPEACADRLLDAGAARVMVTLGREGVLLAGPDGGRDLIPIEAVEPEDVTGAGDALWAGFIMASLDGLPGGAAVRVGCELARRKLRHVGPFAAPIDRSDLYRTAGASLPTGPN